MKSMARPTFDRGPFCGEIPLTNVQRRRLWEIRLRKFRANTQLTLVQK